MNDSSAAALLAPLADEQRVLLRTRKRDGTWVPTPVHLAVEGDHAFFRTYHTSGKAKRLRNFPDVEVAPCDARGRPTGPVLHARATLLSGDRDRHARTLIEGKHPILQRLGVRTIHRLRGQTTQHYEVTEIHA